MSDWHVGQLVVCVDDTNYIRMDGVSYAIKGSIYTIREIVPETPNEPGVGLILEEIVNPPLPLSEPCFYSWRFRPIRKTSIEVFTAILTQAPERVDA